MSHRVSVLGEAILLVASLCGPGCVATVRNSDASRIPQPESLGIRHLSHFATNDSALALGAAGEFLYVAEKTGLEILDVADPLHPRQIGFLSIEGSREHACIQASEGFVYWAEDVGKLRILDVHDPASPREISRLTVPQDPVQLSVQGTSLYLATTKKGLRVIDIQDPRSPHEVDVYSTRTGAIGVCTDQVNVHVACSNYGLLVLKPGDGKRLRLIGYGLTPGNAKAIAVAGGFVYVASEPEVTVFDVSNPSAPVEAGYFVLDGTPPSILSVAESLLCVADSLGTVKVMDAPSRQAMSRRAFYRFATGIADCVIRGSVLYAARRGEGLDILEVCALSPIRGARRARMSRADYLYQQFPRKLLGTVPFFLRKQVDAFLRETAREFASDVQHEIEEERTTPPCSLEISAIAKNPSSTWVRQNSGTARQLLGVDFVDVRHGWAVGEDGTVLKTEDGGNIWAPCLLQTNLTFTDVRFVNASRGWITGYATDTVDYDVVMEVAANLLLYARGAKGAVVERIMPFGLGERLGIRAGDTIVALNGKKVRSGRDLSVRTARIALGERDYRLDLDVLKDGVVHRVAVRPDSSPHSWGNYEAYLESPNKVAFSGVLTLDARGEWIMRELPTDYPLWGVARVDSSTLLVIGQSQFALLNESNTGWRVMGGEVHVLRRLRDLDFTAGIGWIVGSSTQGTASRPSQLAAASGPILHTRDAGRTWEVQANCVPKGVTLLGVCCVDTSEAWAVGEYGVVLHTTDAGRNWVRLETGLNSDFNDVLFLDAGRGWIIGERGVILRTSDGGRSWGLEVVSGEPDLRRVDFADPQNGWIVGDAGTVLRYRGAQEMAND